MVLLGCRLNIRGSAWVLCFHVLYISVFSHPTFLCFDFTRWPGVIRRMDGKVFYGKCRKKRRSAFFGFFNIMGLGGQSWEERNEWVSRTLRAADRQISTRHRPTAKAKNTQTVVAEHFGVLISISGELCLMVHKGLGGNTFGPLLLSYGTGFSATMYHIKDGLSIYK